MKRMRETGDTIIEVLLAITVFSLIAVGAMTVMNQGTNTTQRSLEISIVKQQIDAQGEALRAAYQSALALRDSHATDPTWEYIVARPNMASAVNVGATCPTNYGDGFVLNARTGVTTGSVPIRSMDAGAAPPHAELMYNATNGLTDSYGIWIEKTVVNNFSNGPKVYNFRIRACWYGPGTNVPMQLQTVVRLYDPGVLASSGSPSGPGGPGGGALGDDEAQVQQQPSCGGDGDPCGGGGMANQYFFAAHFTVVTTIPSDQISGCTWYWDDDSIPPAVNINGSDGCAAGTSITHNYQGDSHMKPLQDPNPKYPFPVACKPNRYPPLATGVGAYTYTVRMVIHKKGGGDVSAAPITVTRPACAA